MDRLDAIDLSKRMSREASEAKIAALQRRLLHLRLSNAGLLESAEVGPALCVVFEGWDASGKGGAIKRLVARLDPRHVVVSQYAAPNDDERHRHFLWRFWRSIPAQGGMTVFDRSWYGRVLVERVEGLASPDECERAFGEIVEFERALALEKTVLVKFWLHISEQEQLRRFEARATDPLRRWKLTEDDWRNRAKRGAYERAVEEMLTRTDHHHAHWNLIAAESKHFARVAVLETVIDQLERGMKRAGITVPKSLGKDYDPLV